MIGLKFGNSLKKIGNWAFKMCVGFTGELIFPDSLEQIVGGAFYGCAGLTGLKFGNSLKKIGHIAFYNCVRFTGELIFPDSFQEITDGAFAKCAGSTDVNFPLFLNIAANACDGCDDLPSNLVTKHLKTLRKWKEGCTFLMCINYVDVSFRAMINNDNTDGNAITSFGRYMSNNGISPMMVNAN